ncbi:hypothetical protein OCOJLMKI_5033 [Methylobacterium iners]|uniref:Uncharacterized protein n=1 Tax=Methylobacterium iners TaxID=418707 RepID=A0ABQ4S3X8_9HYPH|nr:hypothetical protein OCOJLMKI_5033 [Methylobacterium iners]
MLEAARDLIQALGTAQLGFVLRGLLGRQSLGSHGVVLEHLKRAGKKTHLIPALRPVHLDGKVTMSERAHRVRHGSKRAGDADHDDVGQETDCDSKANGRCGDEGLHR